MSGQDVFLSYSRADRVAARRFADRLADEGFSVWWDAALRAGETFDEVIEGALRSARSVVVLWSPRSVASRWVRAEATLADRSSKLIPVIIERCDRPLIFELMHTTDLSDWDGSTTDTAWRDMIEDLKRLVDNGRSNGGSAQIPRQNVRQAASPAKVRQGDQTQREAKDRAPPRKLDNMIFAPVGIAKNGNGSNALGADLPSDDSTRFYTSSSKYSESEFHCLELTIGERVEKRFVVSPAGLRIGRAAPADVILSDSRVSRAHCVVQLMDHELQVSDLNSTNGTFVDGERLTGSGTLPVGSVLKVGNVSFRHQLRTSADV